MWKSTLFMFSYNLYKENIALKFTNIYKKINAIKILVSLKNMDKYKTPLFGYNYKIKLSIYFDKLYNILTKYCPYNY